MRLLKGTGVGAMKRLRLYLMLGELILLLALDVVRYCRRGHYRIATALLKAVTKAFHGQSRHEQRLIARAFERELRQLEHRR
jgi:hypothetical protein